jgi:hypothetical protein
MNAGAYHISNVVIDLFVSKVKEKGKVILWQFSNENEK